MTIDLVFNPDNLLKGNSSCSSCSITQAVSNGQTSGYGISVPIIKLTPVPHKSNETTKKEVYYLTDPTSSWVQKFRVELYYVGEDANKTIKGVDLRTVGLTGAPATTLYMDPPQAFSVDTTNVVVSLKDYTGATFISFTRQTAVNATDTSAKAYCSGSGFFCPSGVNSTTTLTATLNAIVDVK